MSTQTSATFGDEPRYTDLTLHFEERQTGIWGCLTGAGGATSELLSENEMRLLLGRLVEIHEGISHLRPVDEQTLRQLGQALHEATFVGSLRELWDGERREALSHANGRVRLRLASDPSHVTLFWLTERMPWETLFCPSRGEFLALDRRLSVVRSPRVPLPVEPCCVRAELKILVVASCPEGLEPLDLKQEMLALQRLAGRGRRLQLATAPTARADLLSHQLLDDTYQILHFMGHGFRTGEWGAMDFGLLLEDEEGRARPMEARHWVRLLGGTGLRLVLLNACHTSAYDASTVNSETLQEPTVGVAQALIRAAIPAVVAMRECISDPSAIAFAEAFYQRLESGDPIDAAMVEGRRAIARYNQEEDGPATEWAIPSLFLRGQGERLFRDSTRSLGLQAATRPAHRPTLPQTIDFAGLVTVHTQDFVGRRHIFKRASEFLSTSDGGYLRLEGLPGTGKTAILAELVKRHGYPCYFNSRAAGYTSTLQFLRDVSSRLIQAFDLSYDQVPSQIGLDHHIFANILQDIGRLLTPENPLILVVDALDEVDPAPRQDGSNVLYLPSALPPSVFVVVSSRPQSILDLTLRTISSDLVLDLQAFEEQNRADVEIYVAQQIDRLGIEPRLRSTSLGRQELIELMVERSENNFMYLFHVLRAIGSGVFDPSSPETIPRGLQGYYEDHWLRLQGSHDEPLTRRRMRVLYYLCQFRRPATEEELVDITGEKPLFVRQALDSWHQFLMRQATTSAPRFGLYHASFRDFLLQEKMLQEVAISLEEIDRDLVRRARKRYGVERRRAWR